MFFIYISIYFKGYTGTNCEIKMDNCASQPCQNNATCKSVADTFYCTCETGFTGRNCSVNVDDCLAAECKNNGSCVDGINGYECACKEGFSGLKCEDDVDECLTLPCQNNGNCTNRNGSYSCHCPLGFTGEFHCVDGTGLADLITKLVRTLACVRDISKHFCLLPFFGED